MTAYVTETHPMLVWPEEVMAYCRRWNHADDDAGILKRHGTRAEWAIQQLDPFLSKRMTTTYLDIGCGMGAITAAIAYHFKIPHVHIIEAAEARKADISGYNQVAHPWNDVQIAAKMIAANCRDASVHKYTPVDLRATSLPQFDLITSFRSWCHHYPAETYLWLVESRLALGGLLCVDVRTNTNNRAVLESAGFEPVAYVSEGYASPKKTKRMVFTRVLS
jgi:SAM-dependent methyltransferase